MLFASLASVASAVTTLPAEVVAQVTGDKTHDVYIVLMDDAPVIAYDGGIAGLEATAATADGDRIHPLAPAAFAYADHLRERHTSALRAANVPSTNALYHYTYASNGFAARMSPAQAATVSTQPGVVAVVPDELRRLTTDASPDFLELTHRQGPWATGYTGENVVVAVIDTGVWPEHPSFADDGSYGAPPPGFSATECDFGSAVSSAQAVNPSDADFTCNNKLLSAQAFGAGFHGGTGEGLALGEYLSARDAHGHGSHTASTAAGNGRVRAEVLGTDWGFVSGIAPRARIAVYKACWSSSATAGGCATSDLVAAIDQAVADGADVINYSIGSSSASLGVDDVAFLFAANAGVMVATSAGNSGPDAGSVGSPATVPWVTSVAAGTQDREFGGAVILADGREYRGVTITGGIPERRLLDAAGLGNALCDPAVEFTSSIADAVVLCQRGGLARVAKSQAVLEQGGVGMILANVTENDTLNTDNHYVPSLHVSAADGERLAAYVAAAGDDAAVTLTGSRKVDGDGSVVAAFSSRGPNELSADILKPDVTAPGVNILAANSPAALLGAPGQWFQSISGTSMSSPHVAGVFALIKQAHPSWTPAMAKSALMTTARRDVWLEDGTTPAEVFAMGAGYIEPGGNIHQRGSTFNPGLVYDTGLLDYAAFTCGAGVGDIWVSGTCAALEDAGYPTDPSDLNVPSIGVAELVGSQTITRTVTSVADKIRVFEAQVKAPPGFTVDVEPQKLTLAPGETGEFSVTISHTRAPLDEWRFGTLAWHSAGYRVQSPIAVRALAFDGPDEITGTGTAGAAAFDVAWGYGGSYEALAHGLVEPVTRDDVVEDDPSNDFNEAYTSGVGITFHEITVPDGTAYARFGLLDAYTDGDDDLDLYVFDPDGNFVGGSGSATSAEEVDLTLPAAGRYSVAVHGWETDGPDAAYTLFAWNVPLDTDGSLTVTAAPTSAVAGGTGTVEIAWSGLEPDTLYLGAVSHTGPDGSLGLTIVGVDSSATANSALPAPLLPQSQLRHRAR